MDHRRTFDAHFLKREEVWCDCTAFSAALPDLWQWPSEKYDRQTKAMPSSTRVSYADHDSKRLFVPIGTYLFFRSGGYRNLALEPEMGDCSGFDSDSYAVFAVILLCPLSNGHSGKDIGQREMEELEK